MPQDSDPLVALIRLLTGQLEPTPDVAYQIGPALPDLRCIVYRTGGTSNFKWHRTLAMTPDEAEQCFESVSHQGYACHIENFFSSIAVGLPETFSPDFPLIQEWN